MPSPQSEEASKTLLKAELKRVKKLKRLQEAIDNLMDCDDYMLITFTDDPESDFNSFQYFSSHALVGPQLVETYLNRVNYPTKEEEE